MEAENRAGSKGSQGSGRSRPAPKSPLVGFGFTPVSTAREGPEPAWRVKFHGLVSSCLSLSLSLSLFHQCGYHAKLSLFRSFPFPALLLLALHPEDRDLSREVDGHDNLWMMMMMMMMYGTPASSRIGSQHPRWIMYPGKVYALRMLQDNGLSSSLTVV